VIGETRRVADLAVDALSASHTHSGASRDATAAPTATSTRRLPSRLDPPVFRTNSP